MTKSLLANTPIALGRILAKAIRPQMVVLPFAVFAALIITAKGFDIAALAFGYVLLVAVYGAVVILNDLADIDTDKLNKRKDIPLAAETMTPKLAKTYFWALVGVGLLAAIGLGWQAVVWFAVYLAMGWLYSGAPKLKNNGYIAPIILGVCYGFMPWWLGGLASGEWTSQIALLSIASFIFAATVISFKDFKDVKGDRATGKRTLLVMHGPQLVRVVAALGTVIACTILLVAAWPTWWMFVVKALAIASLFIFARSDILTKGRARAVWVGGLRAAFYAVAICVFIFAR